MDSQLFRPVPLKFYLFESPARYIFEEKPHRLERDSMIALALVYLATEIASIQVRDDVLKMFAGQWIDRNRFNTNVVGELQQHPVLSKFLRMPKYEDLIGINWDAGVSADIHECRYLIYRAIQEVDYNPQLCAEYLKDALQLAVQPLHSKRTEQTPKKYWVNFYRDSELYPAFTEWRQRWNKKLQGEVRWATEQLVKFYCITRNFDQAEMTLQQWLLWDELIHFPLFHLLQVYHWKDDSKAFHETLEQLRRVLSDLTRTGHPSISREIGQLLRSNNPRQLIATFPVAEVFQKVPQPSEIVNEVRALTSFQERFFGIPALTNTSVRLPTGRSLATVPLPVVAQAQLYTTLDSLPQSWIRRKLYGRNETRRDVLVEFLDQKIVILHGLPGIGKTTLAQDISVYCINEGTGPVLWLNIGQASTHQVFEAISDEFNVKEDFAQQKDKEHFIRALLAQERPQLIVLDDIWLTETYHQLEDVIPSNVMLLVTTRLDEQFSSYDVSTSIHLQGLNENDALECLNAVSGQKFNWRTPLISELLKVLMGHPLSLRIAGGLLDAHDHLSGRDLQERFEELIRTLPQQSNYPQALPSFQSLIDMTVNALSSEAKQVFRSLSVLMSYQFSDHLLAGLHTGDVTAIETIAPMLAELQKYSLIELISETVSEENRASVFNMPELLLEYLRNSYIPTEAERIAFLETCHSFTKAYAFHPEIFRAELENILKALTPSNENSRPQGVRSDGHHPGNMNRIEATRIEKLIEIMMLTRFFFFSYGSDDLLKLLTEAITESLKQKRYDVALELYKARGNTYLRFINDPKRAREDFQAALEYVDSICDRVRLTYGVAVAYIESKDKDDALRAIKRAEAFLRDVSENICVEERAKVTEAWGRYFLYLEKENGPERAEPFFHELYDKAPSDVMKYIGALDLGHVLCELNALGEAEACYMHSLSIARALHNKQKQAYAYQGLGEVSHKRRNYELAQEYFDLALELLTETHDIEQLSKLLLQVILEFKASYAFAFKYVKLALDRFDRAKEIQIRDRLYQQMFAIYTDLDHTQNLEALKRYAEIGNIRA
jgi:tetratricopeptide (TPR) repeat protein